MRVQQTGSSGLSRRRFLGTAAAGVAGAFVLPTLAFGGDKKPDAKAALEDAVEPRP